ncbi:MAG: sugar ABC transporter permease [Firmicutes bacterium]|nr:sugar ABC transporter permease [Bacillota bacterium]
MNYLKTKTLAFGNFFTTANYKVILSMFIMGFGQLIYKQVVKGLIFFAIQAGLIVFFVFRGAADIAGFFTLGTAAGNPAQGIHGDNSILMLTMGLFAIILLMMYLFAYVTNIKDVYLTQLRVEKGSPPLKFKEEAKEYIDKKFYKTILFLPILFVSVFSIIPIVFMILLAFTNFTGDTFPALADWTGFASFRELFGQGGLAPIFFRVLLWNIIWAIITTAINYFGGLGLALLYNKKCVKGKVIWRLFPMLAFAVPGFITLIAFRFLFSDAGPILWPINQERLLDPYSYPISFLGIDATWSARIIGILVAAWLSIPSSMLLATGILSNMNKELYEAAKIDGATGFRQFTKITLPFVIFATTPVIIMQFIGNFNNFGIFFFLRHGTFSMIGDVPYSDTDLLVNWIFRLTVDARRYDLGAAVSLLMFIATSAIALFIYLRSPAYRKEDTFR